MLRIFKHKDFENKRGQKMIENKIKKASVLMMFILALFLVNNYSEAKVPDIVLKQKKAVVTIYINDKDGKQISTGSGFTIDSSGVIATNYHLISKWLEIKGSTILVKITNGAYFPIEDFISFDINNDIALLKVEGKELQTVKIAKDYKPKQGEGIVVIGSPFGLETTVSDGIISSIRGKNELIQITAPISPGSSGSPVFNLKGEVIGIATFLIQGGQNLNFAIPVGLVTKLLDKSKETKPVTLVPIEDWPAPAPIPSSSQEPMDELEKAKIETKKNPDSAEAYFKLGTVYLVRGMLFESVVAYKETIRLKPDFGSAYCNLAAVYNSLDKLNEASDTAKKALVLNYDCYLNLANAYVGLRKFDDAIEAYKNSIKNNPHGIFYYGLGHVYFKKEKYTDAIMAYKDAITHKHSTPDVWQDMAHAYICLGDPISAAEALKEAIKIKPDDDWAHYRTGLCYLYLGNKSAALDEYQILKRLNEKMAEALLNLIYSQIDKELFKTAIKLYFIAY